MLAELKVPEGPRLVLQFDDALLGLRVDHVPEAELPARPHLVPAAARVEPGEARVSPDQIPRLEALVHPMQRRGGGEEGGCSVCGPGLFGIIWHRGAAPLPCRGATLEFQRASRR